MAIPSGEIYLLRNVPLTESYEHTIDFKDRDEQFNYFYSLLKQSINKYTYIRREREYITLELSLMELDDVNYLMYRSADGERLYYAFVIDKVYVNPTTTQVFYSIDVMQTFQFEYKWNASYIKQSHVDRWTPEHKPIYSKTDEGLDYGTEYSVESAFKIKQSTALRWLLVTFVDYDAILDSGYSTDIGYFTPVESSFACALVPIVIDNTDKLSGASSIYVNTKSASVVGTESESVMCSAYMTLVQGLVNGVLGNYIKSISLLSYNPFIVNERYNGYYSVDLNSECTYGVATLRLDGVDSSNSPIAFNTATFLFLRTAPKNIFSGPLAVADWDIGLTDTLPTSAQWDEVKANPYTTKQDKRFESKLLCAPYRYNLLSDWRNNPPIFKNEYMTADKIEIDYSFAASHNAPFRYWIKDYKKDPEGRYTCLSQPLAPEFPVITDAYYSYLLENKNTIQANLTNSIISAGTGAISGAISGAGVGGIGGAIYGGVTGAVSGALNVQAHIRSENAKQADLHAKPDTIISNVDSAFTIVDKNDELTFYRMRICCESEAIIAAVFNMYGYKVNRVEVPNTRSRTRYNYIQTIGANITGSISQMYLTRLKEIYNNGVTIWHYNNEHFNMLDYSYENIEVNLI